MINRRHFIYAGAGAAAAASFLPRKALAVPPAQPPVAVFAKHVQTLDFAELGKRLQSIGAQGIEATLRKGGQIDPENLDKDLGKLVESLDEYEQKIIIAASNVNEVNQETEKYVAQLAKYSIPYLRMQYYKYDFTKPILPQLDDFTKKATVLAELCAQNNVTALYQNHAGKSYFGAALWDLSQVLNGIESKGIAAALDIRHSTLELSQSYESAYRVIRPKMAAVYVKDFDWFEGKPENVPLGQGRARPLFDIIKRDGFVGPLSLHMEYTDHRDPAKLEESWQAIVADMKVLRKWLEKG